MNSWNSRKSQPFFNILLFWKWKITFLTKGKGGATPLAHPIQIPLFYVSWFVWYVLLYLLYSLGLRVSRSIRSGLYLLYLLYSLGLRVSRSIRSGLYLWIRAQNANPSFHEVVILVISTPEPSRALRTHSSSAATPVSDIFTRWSNLDWNLARSGHLLIDLCRAGTSRIRGFSPFNILRSKSSKFYHFQFCTIFLKRFFEVIFFNFPTHEFRFWILIF